MMEYELRVQDAVKKIKDTKAKTVCIQLPDGIKPKADEIATTLENETGARVLIWAGSCFGACDIPLELEHFGVDLLIQWGHTAWKK